MATDISEDEIDALLKKAGVGANSSNPKGQLVKEESLEKLLEEIMSTASPGPPASALSDDRISLFPIQKDKPKRLRFPLVPIWLSIGVLAAFFLGGVLGFYWGKTRPTDPAAPTLETIDTQLSTLIEEVRKLSLWVDPPPPPPEEIIQPLSPSNAMQKLIQDAIL